MPHGRRFLFLTALLLVSAAAGCVTEGETAGGPLSFLWVADSGVPGSRGDLKNESRLDLTYAQWQEQLGNIPAAEESYQRVLKSNPRSPDALLGLARLEQLAGRPQEAEQAFLHAVETAPGNPQALDALGQFYAAEQRWTESLTALGRAAEAAPDDPVYRHHYAVALARSGDTARALVEFTRSVGEAEAHYNVGYVHYEQGRLDLAEREFLQAVTLRPELRSAQTMLDEIRRGRSPSAVLAQAPTADRPEVTQTAAVSPPNWNRQVAPAAAVIAPQAPAPVRTVAASPAPPSAPAGSHEPPQWQMPTRRDPASIFAEQMRNQAPLGE